MITVIEDLSGKLAAITAQRDMLLEQRKGR